MRIIIEGTPNEIIALVLAREERQDIHDERKPNKNSVITACSKSMSEGERESMIQSLKKRIQELEAIN